MPRRKLTSINLKELDIYPALIEELRNNPAYSDKDLTTLNLNICQMSKLSIQTLYYRNLTNINRNIPKNRYKKTQNFLIT